MLYANHSFLNRIRFVSLGGGRRGRPTLCHGWIRRPGCRLGILHGSQQAGGPSQPGHRGAPSKPDFGLGGDFRRDHGQCEGPG
jgi:hypothetical protein